ncbi:hypothetical protein INT45_007606 [Circinella minor]|uniref:GDT1 family protein n=1 Tax=Circinella minor TaxID=1195481 RepID=A0A8H7RXH6_9FUNG|nr:hypothetical protein INT45_007606 [Circinella minor]
MASKWLLPTACAVLLLTTTFAQDNPVEEMIDAGAIPSSTLFNSEKALDDTTPLFNDDINDGEKSVRDLKQSLLISLLMIIVSEIGDKTFLIAAIMAMKHSRLVVFSAAFSSLAIMSVLSAFLGHVVPNLIPKAYTDVLASLLFFCFGARMFYEAWYMEEDNQEEMTEVEEELKQVEDRDKVHKLESLEVGGMESEQVDDEGRPQKGNKMEQAKEGLMNLMQLVFSPVFVQTFVLTFLGEWGDRSQISTIALAAANNVYYVTAGVVVGHTLCTALAVIGGRMLAAKISVKTVTFAGAILFVIFGAYYGYHAYQGQLE